MRGAWITHRNGGSVEKIFHRENPLVHGKVLRSGKEFIKESNVGSIKGGGLVT